jgi:hypothetical protein
MREYDSGAVSAAEPYFSNENNESATRSEEEFVITHSHLLFAAVAPIAASELKKTSKNRMCCLNKDAVMGELPSPTSEIVCERLLYR